MLLSWKNVNFCKTFKDYKGLLTVLFNVSVGNLFFSSQLEAKMVRVLNVAEKNDAAKNIAELMSSGKYRRRDGLSVYNKIYEYEYSLFNQRCTMIMTSVSGHLLNLEFVGSYRKWQSCNPVTLFEAPVTMMCLENYQPIKSTLEREIRNCDHLIIWTDCDREGENIGFEIIEVCKKIKPNIQVHRAKFSEITKQAVTRAIYNLVSPDSKINNAVNVRRELDLRIGAAFTRFQTLRLRRVFPDVLNNQLISYGSCQFPTLGFVVDRYKQVQAFIPELFWKLKVLHKKDDISVEFSWKRNRLFDHTACLALYQLCLEDPMAEVIDIKSRPKSKWRPQPLDTVEFEKFASRKLRIGAKEALAIAEKLYTKGYISYPRTETTIFPKEINLVPLVEMQCVDPNWGAFASRVLEHGPNPRQGTKTDNAHPPIHPIKYASDLQGKEKTVYEFIVRHFLACVSKDAQGKETVIEISVNDEKFAVNGLMIIERNYLDVYLYEKWNAKVIAQYALHETFQPSAIEMVESQTKAPDLLTEADLIALMEKHGIGTDATHAEHIETIKSRLYVGVNENNRFVPGELGMGLVEGYDLMGFHMSKPHLRAELEADLKRICDGVKDPQVVLREQVSKYKQYFIEAVRQANKIDEALSGYFQITPGEIADATYNPLPSSVMKCPKCNSGDIVLKTKRDNKGFFLSCMAYPQCNASMWLPECIEEVTATEEICNECQPSPVYKLKFKVKRGSLMPFYEDEFIKCIGGCDPHFLEVLNVRPITSVSQISRNLSSQSANNNSSRNSFRDSGYSSSQSNSRSKSHIQPFITPTSSVINPSRNGLRDNGPRTSQLNNMSRNQNSIQNFVSPPSSFRRPNDPSSSGGDVMCLCGNPAIKLTVRKEGPNKGKLFYKCAGPPESQCNFFLWSENETPTPNQAPGPRFILRTNTPAAANTGSLPVCPCSIPAKLLTVSKDGPNKGRKFYACANGYENSCKFFLWDDNWNASSNQHADQGINGPSHSHKRTHNASSMGQPSKRKCGLCNEFGHNRKTCPQNTS